MLPYMKGSAHHGEAQTEIWSIIAGPPQGQHGLSGETALGSPSPIQPLGPAGYI